jgi:L-asparaginase II
MPSPPVPLVRVERGGVEEAVHLGEAVVVDRAGEIRAAAGSIERLTYFRSCAKPFQALAGLRAGVVGAFGLQREHVAIMAASHNGEPPHLEVARGLLQRAKVPETALKCGAHWPYYEPAAALVRREMDEPIPIFNNCSGKHAGMLAAARAGDQPLDTYLDPDHPVQGHIREAIEEFTGTPAAAIRYGIDGCSAPNAAVPLADMARAFARLVTTDDSDAQLVVEAMTAHPFLVGGTDRFDTRVMEVTDGRLLAKGGAAGAQCLANRATGEGLAIKLESGDGTWTAVAAMAALQHLGWLQPGEIEALDSFAHPRLRNYRKLVVGKVEPVLQFSG